MPITFDRFSRVLFITAGIVAGLWAVNYLSAVLLPFFVGWLLAYLMYPTVRFLQRRLHFPGRVPSIIVTFIIYIGVLTLIGYALVPPMIEQAEKLLDIIIRHLHDITHIRNFPRAIEAYLSANGAEIEAYLRSAQMRDTFQEIAPRLATFIGGTVDMVVSVIASLITLLYTFFILKDYELLSRGVASMAPEKLRPYWRELIGDVERALNSYVRGQGLVALGIGILFCIGFTIIGFPMAIGMGILIGLLSLIPYLHSFALIPIVLLSLLKSMDTGQSFWLIFGLAMAVFAVVQLITDLVLTPKIMGKAMGLNPAVLLLALSVWGTLLGFIGLIIALPLTTLIIAYYKRYVIKEDKTGKTAAGV